MDCDCGPCRRILGGTDGMGPFILYNNPVVDCDCDPHRRILGGTDGTCLDMFPILHLNCC